MKLDFSYCNGKDCPLRNTCKRYLDKDTIPEDLKKYPLLWIEPHYSSEIGSCEDYE